MRSISRVRDVSINSVWCNFVKQRKSLKGMTPARAAGVSDKL